jgi:phage/plasmid-associated DNA primase
MPTRRALIELFRTDFEWRRMFSKSCRESAACLRGIASQVRDELAEQDKKLPEKLRAASPGILAWAVEGCLECFGSRADGFRCGLVSGLQRVVQRNRGDGR